LIDRLIQVKHDYSFICDESLISRGSGGNP